MMSDAEVAHIFAPTQSDPLAVKGREILRKTLHDAARTIRCHCRPDAFTDMAVFHLADAWALASKNLNCKGDA